MLLNSGPLPLVKDIEKKVNDFKDLKESVQVVFSSDRNTYW